MIYNSQPNKNILLVKHCAKLWEQHLIWLLCKLSRHCYLGELDVSRHCEWMCSLYLVDWTSLYGALHTYHKMFGKYISWTIHYNHCVPLKKNGVFLSDQSLTNFINAILMTRHLMRKRHTSVQVSLQARLDALLLHRAAGEPSSAFDHGAVQFQSSQS